MILAFADVANEFAPSGLIGGMVGAAGGIGFAIWYGWHVTTKTIPSLVKDFKDERVIDRAERRSERDEFKSALRQVVDSVNAVPCQARAIAEAQNAQLNWIHSPNHPPLQPTGGV